MFERRTCKFCQGTEFRVIRGAEIRGLSHQGRGDPAADHWFCPTCGFGAPRAANDNTDGDGDRAA
jgi:hypothetical protein